MSSDETGGEAELLLSWGQALAQRGLRVRYVPGEAPEAAWWAEALDDKDEVQHAAGGHTRGEALEVVVWSIFGRDPTQPAP